MQLGHKLAGAFLGGLYGLAPGAVACVVYSCIYLAMHDELDVVVYESYALPTLAFVGAVVGSFVGSVVGWAGGRAAAWRLSAAGIVLGMVFVSLIAGVLWAVDYGRADGTYLVKINCAGAFVGWVAALSVGLAHRVVPDA